MKKNLPIIYEDSIVTWIPKSSAKKPPPKPYLAKREVTDSDEETDPDMILAIKNSLKEQTIFDVLRNQTPVVNFRNFVYFYCEFIFDKFLKCLST